MTSPLDIAAQVTQIAWSLTELPNDRIPVEAVLRRSLELGGLKDINTLKIRKTQGKTVFGQISAYPQASTADIEKLLHQIEQIDLAPIEVPQRGMVAAGPNWQPVEVSSAAVDLGNL